jgi:NAD(P)-dependent dehydrogenase (short-subunit alcohol dehydrogenase family)
MPDTPSHRVIITGAASGIGCAIAHRLVDAGIAVLLVDKNADGLISAAARLQGGKAATATIAADVTDELAVSRVIETAGAPVTGLVNCAGIYPVTPLMDLPVEEWDRVLAINLRAPFLMSKAFARRLIADGTPGSIVNISSTASILARPGIAHYGASKAGLNQLTRVLAVELAPHGIRVNAVLPGVIGTETVQASLTTPAAEAEMDAKRARIPMGRLGTPEEIAELVTFLLSDAASYSTGGLYTADGGFSLGMARY